VEISQNPANQSPQAKLGYQRGEVAIVPSNRSGNVEPTSGTSTIGGGASDVADVLMELRYANIFSFNNAGIYQRLAVGKTAVSQPGAALMFAKDQKGNLDPETAAAIQGKYMKDPSGDLLRMFWKPDGENINDENAKVLKKWMEDNKIKTSITSFIRSDKYSEERKNALRDLNIQ
jgi:hypothetical protein